MRKLLYISSLVLALMQSSCGETSGSNAAKSNESKSPETLDRPSSYKLVWSDEFDTGTALDSTKWAYDIGSPTLGGGGVWGNNERQYYTSNSKNVKIEDGKLIIQAVHEVHSSAPKNLGVIATSARVRTNTDNYYNAIGSTPYGYYEIRAKISCTKGSWPAIWLLGKNGSWPAQGEIDIMEWSQNYPADTMSSAVHTTEKHGGNNAGRQFKYQNLCNQFHNFQLHWLENKIMTGINGTHVFTYDKPANSTESNWPFTQPAFLILNVAVGGSLGGAVNTSDIANMRMEVEHVKVWKK